MSSSDKSIEKEKGGDGKLKRLPIEVERKLGKLRFENYTPHSDLLKPYCDDGMNTDAALQEMIEKHEKLIRATNAKFMDPTLDLDNLVPKKANARMKRALSEKLERLERKTKRAIVEIARKKQIEDGDLTGPGDTAQQISSDEEGEVS